MPYYSKARKEMVEEFIKCLGEDKIPWHQPWKVVAPKNAATDRAFQGSFNKMMLYFSAMKNGYKDHRWCTFKQANDKHWKIKPGEHGTMIEFWTYYDNLTNKNLTKGEVDALIKENSENRERISVIARNYTVFNAEQIEGIPPLPEKNEEKSDKSYLDVALRSERVANGMGVALINSDNAAYSPKLDKIQIPAKELFSSYMEYSGTLLHELSHATGHESRLNRDLSGDFGTMEYAREELRAEIASVFLNESLGVSYGDMHMDNHKAYIQSWIQILKNDPDELFKAFKDADKIHDYIVELYPSKELSQDVVKKKPSLSERLNKAKENCTVNHTIEKPAMKEMVR